VELTTPGRVLGDRYRLVEPLARGGMATVWVADDPVLSRRVAVKVLRADLAEDDATRTRFRNEAIAAAKLSHPNIVSTYDTGDDDGVAYIVMELVEGPTLRHLIDAQGGLPVLEVVRIGVQVADALDAAHRAGLVHRDVKPANVLVPPGGPVKVTDFGIAKAVGTDDLTRTGTVMGTARYLAPEQVNGRPTDPRTDVYALGLLLFEALCGHPPFGGDTDIATAMARLTTAAPAVRAERPEVSVALDDVIHRCLARNPAARFGSAAAVRDALDRARLDPTGPIPRPAPPAVARPGAGARPPTPAAPAHTAPHPVAHPVRPTKRKRRSGWLWILLVLLLVIGAGVAAFLLASDNNNTHNGAASASAPPASQAKLTATDFDPQGDGHEGSDSVANAVDGNPSTAWSTEVYQRAFPDGNKTGVGIAIDLGGQYDLHRITVDAVQAGWSASIYVSSQPTSSLTSLGDWGAARTSGDDLGLAHSFDVGSINARSVLVWFTALPSGPDGHALQVAAVTVA
jgi:eukaryotic-like serine/threonine-protein kinase